MVKVILSRAGKYVVITPSAIYHFHRGCPVKDFIIFGEAQLPFRMFSADHFVPLGLIAGEVTRDRYGKRYNR